MVTIGNVTVDIDVEEIAGERLYVRDRGCPWVCARADWASAIEALQDERYIDDRHGSARSHAYQDLCDRIRPIATAGAAVDLLRAAEAQS